MEFFPKRHLNYRKQPQITLICFCVNNFHFQWQYFVWLCRSTLCDSVFQPWSWFQPRGCHTPVNLIWFEGFNYHKQGLTYCKQHLNYRKQGFTVECRRRAAKIDCFLNSRVTRCRTRHGCSVCVRVYVSAEKIMCKNTIVYVSVLGILKLFVLKINYRLPKNIFFDYRYNSMSSMSWTCGGEAFKFNRVHMSSY